MAGSQLEQDLRGDVIGQVAHYSEPFACCGGSFSKIKVQHVLLDDRDLRIGARRKLRAQLDGEVAVQLDCDYVLRPCGKASGNGASSGSNFDYGAAGDVTERSHDPLDGLRVVEEVLSEFGLGRHGLS